MRPSSAIAAVIAFSSFIVPTPASAQTVEVSGLWALSVTTDQGTTTPSVTLEQSGEDLTGHYSSAALGESDVEGSVSGSEVTFRFSSVVQGQAVSVVYRGTVDENGEMSGTIDIAGGLLTGRVTAIRTDA